jgi:hypothetical protein
MKQQSSMNHLHRFFHSSVAIRFLFCNRRCRPSCLILASDQILSVISSFPLQLSSLKC